MNTFKRKPHITYQRNRSCYPADSSWDPRLQCISRNRYLYSRLLLIADIDPCPELLCITLIRIMKCISDLKIKIEPEQGNLIDSRAIAG